MTIKFAIITCSDTPVSYTHLKGAVAQPDLRCFTARCIEDSNGLGLWLGKRKLASGGNRGEER